MALNTTLANLVLMLKAEVGDSLVAGTQKDATYKYLLATKQKLLAAEFDIPYLEDRWDVPAPAGSRYLTLPAADYRGKAYSIDFTRPLRVYRYWNIKYEELRYGIGIPEFNYLNPDIPQALDPIQKWQWWQTSDLAVGPTVAQQFEVWPVNVTAQTVRFIGQRLLSPLLVDADKADLDDLLLVFSVAVEILERSKQADAPLRLQNASRRLKQIRAGYAEVEDRPAVFGGNRLCHTPCKKILVAGSIPEQNYLLAEDGNPLMP